MVDDGPRALRVRRLGGDRAGEIRLTRFLRHPAVQPEIMLAEASAQTAERCQGRAVLALQDTTVLRSTGGGGTYLHCVLALDAESGAILGLIDASFVHRDVGRRAQRRAKPIEEKESFRWLEGADQAATVCACARSLTVIADREGDIYEAFALRPEHSELLVRAAHDRALDEGERLWTTLSGQPVAGWAEIDLPARPGRRARMACLALRHASLSLVRPRHGQRAGLPARITVNAIEVVEEEPPAGQDALHWRLLTTQPVRDAADALAVVEQYRRRWAIEIVLPQLTKASALAIRADGNHVADLDLGLGHHDPVDEQFDQSAALSEVGASQTILDATAERLG